jgi:hypothetical protein
MAAPIINQNTSVLGYRRFQQWTYQPFATGDQKPWRWQCSALPEGLVMERPLRRAVTGSSSTDLISLSEHNFEENEQVEFFNLIGGEGLLSDKVYFVKDVTTNEFKVSEALGGIPVSITTDLTSGRVALLETGRITGAATRAGVFNVGIVVSNSAGETSAPLQITIGIEGAAEGTHSGVDLIIDTITKDVSRAGINSNQVGTAGVLPLFSMSTGDQEIISVQWQRQGVTLSPSLQGMALYLKEYAPEQKILVSDEWNESGSGDMRRGVLLVDLESSVLRSIAGDYETDEDASFVALAEIEWFETNTMTGIGPSMLRRTSNPFRVRIRRDFGQMQLPSA